MRRQMTTATAYIAGLGAHLPGLPVTNDRMARHLGVTDSRALMIGRKTLKQNRIRSRHYALDDRGKAQTSNAAMAASAGRIAIADSGFDAGQVDFLAAASSQGDMMAPGIASAVHGALNSATADPTAGRTGPLEVASFTSFCASGMMAMKAAAANVMAGLKSTTLVCASEFASRFLRQGYLAGAKPRCDSEFLRWTLSDGAGAAVIADRPAAQGLSLRIDHIDLVSYADRMPTCMFGGVGNEAAPDEAQPWSQYPTLQEAVEAGAFHLRQDLKLLDQIVPVGMARYLELIDDGVIRPEEIDHALYHFSSDIFRQRMVEQAEKLGAPINHNKIFTNLYDKGNTGSASIFIMLEELVRSGRAKPGEKILCMVPESGRFIIAFMILTVVGPKEGDSHAPADNTRQAGEGDIPTTAGPVLRAAVLATGPAEAALTVAPDVAPSAPSARVQQVGRGLTRAWVDFETRLNTVPLIDRLNRNRLGMDDYRAWLVNLRQQVVDGSRWISRAASNIVDDDIDLRSTFVGHAGAEHRDYTLLEQDYVACGGTLSAIRNAPKNAGSEALSAWMFQRASQENPFDLLGAMFIIEGLGQRVAPRWEKALRAQLGLGDDQIRFLSHHADHDDGHMDKLWEVLARLDDCGVLDTALAEQIVRTAQVTARLYRLQLEEIDLHSHRRDANDRSAS